MFPQILFAPEGAAPGGAPASTPSAPPSPAVSTSPASPSGDGDEGGATEFPLDVGQLGETDFDSPDEPAIVLPGAEPGTLEPGSAPVAQPEATPSQPQPIPGTPPAPQAPPVEPQPTPAPAQPQSPPPAQESAPPVDVFSRLREAAPQLREALSKSTFALTEEERAELDTDVMTAIPKLSAKIYHEAVMASFAMISQQVPIIVSHMVQAERANTQSEELFFSSWPDLRRPELKPDIVQACTLYRQMHPKATAQDVILKAGAMVAAMHGLQIAPRTGVNGNGAQPAPSAPPRAVQPQPFAPARAGPAGGPQQQTLVLEPMAGLGLDYDE